MARTSEDERREVRREFDEAVNMTPGQLRKWLDTDEHIAQRPSGDVTDTDWRY
jgi:hypothetical protein